MTEKYEQKGVFKALNERGEVPDHRIFHSHFQTEVKNSPACADGVRSSKRSSYGGVWPWLRLIGILRTGSLF